MFEPPRPFLIGMVHLPALPGSPNHRLSMARIIEAASKDARTLAEAGFDAVMIENYGDAPFTAHRIDAASVAAMAVIADRVREASGLTIGINALRNDARSALAIAAATNAEFVRVNVHTGVYATDQGFITGQADETMHYRRRLGVDVAVFADVHVKHSMPISQPDLAEAARETAYRGFADGLIVTGVATGRPTDASQVRRVKEAVPDRPVIIGSGATTESIRALLDICDGAIVGTHIKENAQTTAPIDPRRAAAYIRAARS